MNSHFKNDLAWFHLLLCMFVIATTFGTVGNFQVFLAKQTLFAEPASSVIWRFFQNMLLLLLFVVQHSVMATSKFKVMIADWARVTVSERLVYVSATCASLMVMILHWQPIPEVSLWMIDTSDCPLLWLLFTLVHIVGWLMLGLATMLMDPGELVGYSQVYNHYATMTPTMTPKPQALCEIYSSLRHPGPLVVTSLLWIHPLMTLDRLLLACVFTIYLLGHLPFGHTYLDTHHVQFARSHFTTKVKVTHTVKVTHSQGHE